MTLFHRRIIYIIFFIIFSTAAPIIVFYSSGYRYNFKKNNWQKTGLIFLETKPKEVNVYLNGKKIDQYSPIHIKNLLPNEYTIILTKPGYAQWKKNISVYAGESTTIQYVRLFKDSPFPRMIVNGDINQAIFNENKTKIAYIKKNEAINNIYVLNISDNSSRHIYSTKEDIVKLAFVNNKLAVYLKNNILIIDALDPATFLNFSELSNVYTAANIKIDPNNTNYIYYLRDGYLMGFNLITRVNQTFDISNTRIIDYFVAYGKIYFLNNESLNKIMLKKASLENVDEKINITTFDSSNGYSIIEIKDNLIVVQNNTKQDLILFDETSGQKEIIKNITDYELSSDGNKLLFYNTLGLLSYDRLKNNDKYTLFARTAEQITASAWYSVDTHLLYIINGTTLKITENLYANRLTYDLIKLDNIRNILTDKKGDEIYFIAQIGNQRGLYRIEIE
ncbi:hypothetical protein COT27_01920 [Candidatus Kuenenbacteria bacterium CG08_land_8_20_14_0_20_37_23]|uniref:PEGA domain-containing protein n=1 Tax=Candidatus Kuenenbacteria bacterium CG08_land_8_20_14_0_20_37_23 TaxID=1974617 RepID=A0A2M6XSP8_9BACT|nr:MAG: hypothetical protein COT27_01920 [Candidatus Kuenenbacteria bacterium CG08_land_8_20_14_0_20_37_23]